MDSPPRGRSRSPLQERREAAVEASDSEESSGGSGNSVQVEESAPASDTDESNNSTPEVFNVEKIVGKRLNDSVVEYRVKWAGFDESDNTWEPISNLDCLDLVRQYEAEQLANNDEPIEEEPNVEIYPRNHRRPLNDIPPDPAPDPTPANVAEAAASEENVCEPNAVTAEPLNHNCFDNGHIRLENDENILNSALINNDGPSSFGFPDFDKEAEKIVGATDVSGELKFLIQWKNSQETNLVPSCIANVKWPQVVIQFYEERLTFDI